MVLSSTFSITLVDCSPMCDALRAYSFFSSTCSCKSALSFNHYHSQVVIYQSIKGAACSLPARAVWEAELLAQAPGVPPGISKPTGKEGCMCLPAIR